jgi:hypothetical protein
MRAITITLASLVLLGGCQQNSAPTTTTNSPVTPSAATVANAPATFQIRDFKLDEQKQSYGGVIYKGRGTLVSKDVRLTKGSYIVWLTVKQAHKNEEQWKTMVLMHDGIGTLETSDYLAKDDADKGRTVKYLDWKILGYTALSAGTIEAEDAAVSN